MKFLLVPLLIIGMFLSFAAALVAMLFFTQTVKTPQELVDIVLGNKDSADVFEEFRLREDRLAELAVLTEEYRERYEAMTAQATAEAESLAKAGILPTPTARCWNVGTEKERPEGQPTRRSELNHLAAQDAGKPSQLNPRFVEEMMGFPVGWTASPFLDGEKNQ